MIVLKTAKGGFMLLVILGLALLVFASYGFTPEEVATKMGELSKNVFIVLPPTAGLLLMFLGLRKLKVF